MHVPLELPSAVEMQLYAAGAAYQMGSRALQTQVMAAADYDREGTIQAGGVAVDIYIGVVIRGTGWKGIGRGTKGKCKGKDGKGTDKTYTKRQVKQHIRWWTRARRPPCRTLASKALSLSLRQLESQARGVSKTRCIGNGRILAERSTTRVPCSGNTCGTGAIAATLNMPQPAHGWIIMMASVIQETGIVAW